MRRLPEAIHTQGKLEEATLQQACSPLLSLRLLTLDFAVLLPVSISSRQSVLTDHLLTHSGAEPFECALCKQTFK